MLRDPNADGKTRLAAVSASVAAIKEIIDKVARCVACCGLWLTPRGQSKEEQIAAKQMRELQKRMEEERKHMILEESRAVKHRRSKVKKKSKGGGGMMKKLGMRKKTSAVRDSSAMKLSAPEPAPEPAGGEGAGGEPAASEATKKTDTPQEKGEQEVSAQWPRPGALAHLPPLLLLLLPLLLQQGGPVAGDDDILVNDITKLPTLLDARFEALDEDAALR